MLYYLNQLNAFDINTQSREYVILKTKIVDFSDNSIATTWYDFRVSLPAADSIPCHYYPLSLHLWSSAGLKRYFYLNGKRNAYAPSHLSTKVMVNIFFDCFRSYIPPEHCSARII